MSKREHLLGLALQLPIADENAFLQTTSIPEDADPQDLRVVDDTAFRGKLIRAGLAVGIQSPKGPQKAPSIIRLYQEGNAPACEAVRRVPRSKARVGEKPTVEQIKALLTRFDAVEAHVARELSIGIDAEIAELQQAVSAAPPELLSANVTALQQALEKKNNGARFVREETFRRMQSESFLERRFLSLLAV